MVHISYIEIYNDVAYDLLNVASGTSARLPKVLACHRARESSRMF